MISPEFTEQFGVEQPISPAAACPASAPPSCQGILTSHPSDWAPGDPVTRTREMTSGVKSRLPIGFLDVVSEQCENPGRPVGS